MKLLIVLNPVSGGTNKREFLLAAKNQCRNLGVELLLFRTTSINDVQNLKDYIAQHKPDRIGSAGGDGTFLLVVKATIEQPVPVGFIPMGSANGMATELGVRPDPQDALVDLIGSQIIAKLDVLKINDEHLCLHMGDVGLNARVVAGYDSEEGRGMTAYGKHLIGALAQIELFSYRIKVADQTHSGEAVMVGIGNGTRFGTGIPLNTVGNPFDGKFEITVVKNMDADTLIRAGLSMLDETFMEGIDTEVYSVSEAEIELEGAQPFQLDGEPYDPIDRISVKVLPGVIPLITTAGNPYLEG